MREILFRGKRIDNGKWVQGLYVHHRNVAHYIIDTRLGGYEDINGEFFVPRWYRVDPETVGQYTGLCDKNGKKVFEGDILEFPDEVWESFYTACGTEYNSWETKNRGVVGYCEDYGRFDFEQYLFNESSVNADLHENGALQFADFIRDLEVIGNIHDNPELMKGREEKDYAHPCRMQSHLAAQTTADFPFQA